MKIGIARSIANLLIILGVIGCHHETSDVADRLMPKTIEGAFNGRLVKTIKIDEGSVVDKLVLSPDGHYLAYGLRFSRWHIVDLAHGVNLDAPISPYGFAYSSDSRFCATFDGRDGRGFVVLDPKDLHEVGGPTEDFPSLFEFSPDSRHIVIAVPKFGLLAPYHVLKYLDLPDLKTSWTRTLPGGLATALCFSPDGEHLAVATRSRWLEFGGTSGGIEIINARSGGIDGKMAIECTHMLSLVFTHDSETILAGGAAGDLSMWNIRSFSQQWLRHTDIGSVNSLLLIPGTKEFVAFGNETHIEINAKGEAVVTGDIPPESIRCGTFSSDGSIFAACSAPNTIDVWRIRSTNETSERSQEKQAGRKSKARGKHKIFSLW